jgi:V-type H+-transporting ATPase subunit C
MSAAKSKILLLLSLPSNAAPAGGDPQTQLDQWIAENVGVEKPLIAQFETPIFKIGTLDNLIQQSDDLAKLDSQFQSIVNKASEIISSIYEGSVAKAQIAQAKRVDGKAPEDYMAHFQWNSSKYRVDKSISELVDLISKEAFALDSDVRTSFQAYTQAKSNLSAVDRKQSGNLSVRSLHDVVTRDHFVLDSEYLQTVLIAIPKATKKEFLANYETLTPMVVPRSAVEVASDSEFILYSVTLFKKYVAEFTAKARDHKWTPREFHYSDSVVADMKKEQESASATERKQWAEIANLSRTAYSDIVKAWAHIKAIRVYVESILRYGLPPNFITAIFEVPPSRTVDKAEKVLLDKFGYLGGHAFDKDKKGRVKNVDLSEYGAIVDNDYKPFVLYQIELV